MDRSGLLRLLPWTKASPRGVAVANGNGAHETKSDVDIDFVSDLSAGRVVYVNHAVPGDVEAVRRSTAYVAALYCYVAIRYRAENVAEPPLRIYAETDDGDELITDHPLLELLDEPSPDYDMGELVELTQTYWDIGGDALWTKDANLAGSTGRLTPWGADEYDVASTADRIMGRWEVKTVRGPKPFDPEDVVYFRYPHPGKRRRGLSPVDVALSWLNLGQRTQATIRGLLKNAMFPSVVISTHPSWSPDEQEFERFKALLDQFHTGPDNAGKPFVTLGGGKAERVAFTLRDLLPGELLDRVEANVAAAFRIPPVVLGYHVGLKNSPWSQMEQAHRQAYDDAIAPLWRRYEKALTRQLLRPIDPDRTHKIAFDISGVAALADDESQKITDAVSATFWTLNQRLIHSGQDPLPDSDPRGAWIEVVDKQAMVAPDVGGQGLEADEVDGDGDKAATKAAGADRDWKWALFDLMTKAQEGAWERDSLAQLRTDRDAMLEEAGTEAFTKAWERALEMFGPGKAGWCAAWTSTDPLLDALATKAPPGGDPKEIAALIEILAKRLNVDAWHERMAPLVESTGRTALKELAAELSLVFSVLEPSLLDYVRDEAGWLITKIDTTTRDRVAAELKAGLAQGENVSTLRKRIQASEAFGEARAELIARTETTRVTNGSQRKAMSDYQLVHAGVVEKSWLSARDSRVRAEHADLDDGKWIGVDDDFANGTQGPSEPRCRCTLLYRIPED